MLTRKSITVTIAACCAAIPCFASDFDPQVLTRIQQHIHSALDTPAVYASIRAQNALNETLTQADIDRLDTQWRSEASSGGGPLVNPILANPLSAYLRDVVAREKGLFTEMIIMDNRGLNTAQSSVTSDYWQGDEAKWQQTYLLGPRAFHVSEVEFDESSEAYQVQISIAINDPETGLVIGAATVGVDAERIE